MAYNPPKFQRKMAKGNNTQTPATKTLAKALRKTHRETRSWLQTARLHNITDSDGTPNKGMAYRIARDGYEPKDHQLRIRIGLPINECPTCHARIKQEQKFRTWKHLDDLNADQIRYLFEHRETIA